MLSKADTRLQYFRPQDWCDPSILILYKIGIISTEYLANFTRYFVPFASHKLHKRIFPNLSIFASPGYIDGLDIKISRKIIEFSR